MTPNQIAKLPVGTHPIKQHSGLRLEVRASRRTWTLRRRDDAGKLKQQVVGHYPELSLAGAVAACEAFRKAAPQTRAPIVEAVTVRSVVHAYCVEHIRARRKNWRHDEALIWRHLDDLADREAGGVGRADAHRFLMALSDRPAIQRRLKMELASGWEHAMVSGALPDAVNPWARIRVAPAARKDRFLTDSEVSALVVWLRADGNVPEIVRDALLITLGTGCRSGEVVGMRCRDLDLAAGTWTLETTKNGLGRIVYLNGWVLDILRGRGLAGEHVFTMQAPPVGATQPPRQQWISKVANRAIGKGTCPVADWTPHVLRKTMRTGLARLGVSHEVAELAIGHRLGGVAGIYNLYGYAGEQRAALEKWGAHLAVLVA